MTKLFFLILIWWFGEQKTVKVVDPYQKGYFIFPINPGTQTSLSGSFGDIRINHFHAGLDIRTGGKEGLNIYAAASGYVSRINVSRGGYGNALYITHPNGLTTVYGHLKEYSEPIKKYLLKRQYAQQKWEMNLVLEPGEIPVNKGEFVAFSGNTGGSGGPHLHFEIRDKEENTLDPALFGFNEIVDNQSPVIDFISFRCMSKDARVNGEFGVFDFPVTRLSNGHYRLNSSIKLWGDVGLELQTYDKAETSPFRLGIKQLDVKIDDIPSFYYDLDRLSFDNKLDLNLHANYERLVNEGKKIHKAYFEPGNTMDFYEYDQNLGVWNMRDAQTHQVKIEISDSFKNKTICEISVVADKGEGQLIPNKLVNQSFKTEVYDGIVKFIRQKSNQVPALVYNEQMKPLHAEYVNSKEETFVFDMDDDYYSHISNQGELIPLPINKTLYTQNNKISNLIYTIDFDDQLYQKIFVNFRADGHRLLLDKDRFPLKGPIHISWNTARTNIKPQKDKVYLTDNRKPKYVGGEWQANQVNFSTKELGTYEVFRDETAPKIEIRKVTSKELIFRISDDLSGIAKFNCFVNGNWVLMEYEYKNGLIWAEPFDPEIPFAGEVVVEVVDHCQNINSVSTFIK